MTYGLISWSFAKINREAVYLSKTPKAKPRRHGGRGIHAGCTNSLGLLCKIRKLKNGMDAVF
jgi:hypothetical protein